MGAWRAHDDAGADGRRARHGRRQGACAGAARHAAYAAGQAAVVAHVAAHELGAAAYAIKAVRAAVPDAEEPRPPDGGSAGGSATSSRQPIRELVLDDQRLRNDLCWSVFDC